MIGPKAYPSRLAWDAIGGGVLVWRKGSFKLRAWSHKLKSTQVLLFRAGDSLEWLAIARSAYSLCMLVIKRCRLHECEPNDIVVYLARIRPSLLVNSQG